LNAVVRYESAPEPAILDLMQEAEVRAAGPLDSKANTASSSSQYQQNNAHAGLPEIASTVRRRDEQPGRKVMPRKFV
jgi:hypothetical protein